MFVVMSMDCGPPKRASLHRSVADNGEDELHETRRVETAVGKVAVIKPCDGEHPYEVERHGDGDGCPAPASPNHCETACMQKDKREGALYFNALGKLTHSFNALRKIIGVDALPERT